MFTRTMFGRLSLALVVSIAPFLPGCASTTGSTSVKGTTTVHGYVLDSACAFLKGIDKPVSKQCAIDCGRAGSPLVILADDGTIWWPISNAMPAISMNARLLEFAGERVVATGTGYERGESCAIVLDKVEKEPAPAPKR
jgi:hypothetical protein